MLKAVSFTHTLLIDIRSDGGIASTIYLAEIQQRWYSSFCMTYPMTITNGIKLIRIPSILHT